MKDSSHPVADRRQPFRVVIAGGGVAGLEAVLALDSLAGDLVDVTLLSPGTEFVYRPMTVQEPFAYPSARRYPLAQIVQDARSTFVEDAFDCVDTSASLAHTTTGRALPYDALMLALGTTTRSTYDQATTLDDRQLDDQLHGIVQDIEEGYVHDLAFVMPAEGCWPLPLYELALQTAERAREMSATLSITIVTPERAPLDTFGSDASEAVSALISERGIEIETGSSCEVPDSRHLIVRPSGRAMEVDRVIALPEIHGPNVHGLPADLNGFIPVDDHQRVRGYSNVFAAGDATTFPIKHGGVSAQQADVAAHGIAQLAGAPVTNDPLRPVIHGLLLTGRAPLYLVATLVGGRGFQSRVSTEPLWSPPVKIHARYLAPYLEKVQPLTA